MAKYGTAGGACECFILLLEKTRKFKKQSNTSSEVKNMKHEVE
jgi:hypothetical protein